MNANRTALALPLFAAASLLACSSSPPSERPERIGETKSAVIAGKDSDVSQDAVVLLVHYDPKVANVGSCTGTLLSDRVVLTARHCVADTDEAAACDVMGTPLAEGAVRGNHPAKTLYVFVGPNRPDFGDRNIKPDGIGAQVLDDGGKNLCNHDIALLILEEPIANAKIAQIRLDSPIKKTDKLTAVGWGVTDSSPYPDVRQQRSGIEILGIGPDDTNPLPVPPNEFEVGESICSGDSGGPAFAKSGAIVGIVSRGGNATKPDPQNPAKSCVNGDNLYTKVEPFKQFIVDGLKVVDADPWYEGGADPRLLKPGNLCTDPAQCRSNLCILDPTKTDGSLACTEDCAESQTCPEGQSCVAEGDTQVCRTPAAVEAAAAAKTTTTTGCTTSPERSSNGALGFVLAALGLVALRRRSAK